MLDSLYEANKVKVVLRSNDYDFSQTLMLHAYDEQSAEYGLRSDKLELQTGEYTVVGFYLYDRAEKEPIFVGIPSEKNNLYNCKWWACYARLVGGCNRKRSG